jgi:hypothetical protein
MMRARERRRWRFSGVTRIHLELFVEMAMAAGGIDEVLWRDGLVSHRP